MKELTNEYMEELENNYISGMEDGVKMVKTILGLPRDIRKKFFYDTDIAKILDHFDFQQIHELLKAVDREPQKELHKYYVIRGIKVRDDGVKKVISESGRLKFEPDEDMVKAFMECHPHVSFSSVETIYVLE